MCNWAGSQQTEAPAGFWSSLSYDAWRGGRVRLTPEDIPSTQRRSCPAWEESSPCKRRSILCSEILHCRLNHCT